MKARMALLSFAAPARASALAGWAATGLALLLGAALAPAGMSAWQVLALLLIAPVAEELLFRSGLQEALLRRWHSALAANVATAAVFALAHALARDDALALAVVVPGLLLGAVYGRTRQVAACIALHAAMNAVWLAGGAAAWSFAG